MVGEWGEVRMTETRLAPQGLGEKAPEFYHLHSFTSNLGPSPALGSRGHHGALGTGRGQADKGLLCSTLAPGWLGDRPSGHTSDTNDKNAIRKGGARQGRGLLVPAEGM